MSKRTIMRNGKYIEVERIHLELPESLYIELVEEKHRRNMINRKSGGEVATISSLLCEAMERFLGMDKK